MEIKSFSSGAPLFLIDAYSQIYRGFYAVRGLTNSKGEPSNAVFAIAKLTFAIADLGNSGGPGAFVFDRGKSAKRIAILPEYKANRPPMPEELAFQLPQIRAWILASGWPIVEKESCEADDLIALAVKSRPDSNFRIISSDKDLAQLVNEKVRMLVPDRKGGGFESWGRDDVIKKFGVPPEKIPDYLSLTGDSSDNIPGVDGVGPVTASKLLSSFSGIEEMLSEPDKIEPEKLRAKISSSAEILRRNLLLTSLLEEAPEADRLSAAHFERRPPCWEELEKIADYFGMQSILKEIARRRDGTANFAKGSAKVTCEKYETPDLFDFQ